jgi:hypothetical protein
MIMAFLLQRNGARWGATLCVLAGGAALTLAGCAEAPKTLAPAQIPPQAAAPPPVALSSRVIEAASEYRDYMRRATATPASFPSGPAIEESLVADEAYEAQQLSRGVIAYGALVALQDPGFVAGVRTFAVDPDGRKAMAARIASDPSYVAVLPGAAGAAGLVITTLNTDSAKLRGSGELVKQFAYDVQHQAWSKKDVVDPAARLARAKSLSATPMTPVPTEVETLKGAVTGSDAKALVVSGAPSASAPPYTPVVSRALAIAALAALGEGGEDNTAQVTALLDESTGGFCLNMSKLNLYQCLAVAKPWYEDVFCLGQHVLIDTSQCVAKEAGTLQPVQMASTPPATAKPQTAPSPGAAQ